MTSISLEFVQDLLKKDYPDVTIQEIEGAPGSKRGDNYTSMVYRVTLKGVRKLVDQDESTEVYEAWEGSIIYKCLPESILRREAYKSDELFCNEVAFYNKIWPTLSNFQRQWEQVTEPLDCIPKCYLAQNDVVILEDLKQLGYAMPDRRKGLSIDQCYYVLKKLSHFHALSLAMKYYDPEGFNDLVNIQDGVSEVFFLSKNEEYYRSYYKEAITNAIVMVEEELKDSSDKEKYLEPFKQFCSEETFFQSMVEMVAPKEPLAVICHGDCWTNNFLFKLECGKIAGMYIVDFQLARYASPGLDLAFLLYLCLERSQRVQHLPRLLRYYSDHLHRTLTDMNGDTLDTDTLFDMVQEEFRSSSRFGLGLALDMCPIMTCDSDEAPNLYQAKESESLSGACVRPVRTSNAACRNKMTDLVRELVDNGLL